MGWAYYGIFLSIVGLIEPFFAKVDSKIVRKILDSGYPLSTENVMMHCEERHPLLMKYFKTFLRRIGQVGGASRCIFQSFYGSNHVMFNQGWLSNYSQNARFWVPAQYQNGMLNCKERHPLHMKCFKTFLPCTRSIGGAADSIYQPLMGRIMSFSTQSYSQNTWFWVPSQCNKWDVVLLGETSISHEVFQNLPPMHKADGRGFW